MAVKPQAIVAVILLLVASIFRGQLLMVKAGLDSSKASNPRCVRFRVESNTL